ncbi:MAG TPA: methyltransferase domain-containing protein [Nakamurella sp.]|jgi:23S rRNA (guanine745-N1)-methyltransferase
MTPGLDAVLSLLACPLCARPLIRADGVVGCAAGHRFDIARQGHLTLLGRTSRTDTGDSADMVAARQQFLDSGHFAPLTRAILDVAGDGPVLDLGAGTGHHLQAVVRAGASGTVGLAIDTSTYAARRAARVHPRVGSVIADAWSRLPVRDASVGTLLSVFAPRDPREIGRMVRPGGRVVVVTPTPEHQAELRDHITLLAVDPDKAARLQDALGPGLTPAGAIDVRHAMRLSREDVDRLIRMGPSAYHRSAEEREGVIARLDELTVVTLAVTVSVFTRP